MKNEDAMVSNLGCVLVCKMQYVCRLCTGDYKILFLCETFLVMYIAKVLGGRVYYYNYQDHDALIYHFCEEVDEFVIKIKVK